MPELPDQPARSAPRARCTNLWVVPLAGILAGALLWGYHARFWWPTDEGVYAHVAARVAAGEVLNRDVQDLHLGYVNLLHAGAWRWFGPDLLSLRWPLVVAGTLAAMLAAWLLCGHPVGMALGAGLVTAALSIPLFLDPTANWYCLPLLFLLAALLGRAPQPRRRALFLAGCVLGLMFGVRQLSAVLVAPGVALRVLCAPGCARAPSAWAGRVVLALAALGYGLYVKRAGDGVAFVLFGLGPLCVLGWAIARCRARMRRVLRTGGWLAGGALLALAPLCVYHLAHGSLGWWIDDTVIAALRLPRLPFFDLASYGTIGVLAFQALFDGTVAGVLNGLFWLVALVAPAGLAWRLFTRLRRAGDDPLEPGLVVPILGLMYAAVAVHYAIPIYLSFALAPVLVGHLWLSAAGTRRVRWATLAALLALVAVGLSYQAAQPLSRGLEGTLRGDRMAANTPLGIPHASLRSTRQDAERYRKLVRMIDQLTADDAAIFAVPWAPELFVLADRRNPFRFYNTAFGLRSERDLATASEHLRRDPPAMVLYQPQDKYMTPLAERLMDEVRSRYRLIGSRYGFEVYLDPRQQRSVPRS